jgi:hypothetical protein
MGAENLRINPATMTALCEVFPDCPPDWAKYFCETEEHFYHLNQTKQFYTDLHHLLTCYFSGFAPPQFPPEWSECLWTEANRLLKLYDLLFWGWNFLEFDSEETPGSIFQALVLRRSFYSFLQCKAAWKVHSPRKTPGEFKLVDDCIKAAILAESPTYESSPKDQRDREQLHRKLKHQIATVKTQQVRADLLEAEKYCFMKLKKLENPPKTVINALKAYEKAVSEQETWILKQTQPRKANKGYKIIKGKRHDL